MQGHKKCLNHGEMHTDDNILKANSMHTGLQESLETLQYTCQVSSLKSLDSGTHFCIALFSENSNVVVM